jgi:HD-like signal output (HDOD) protein
MILQAVDCAHQFILKPCDIEVLKKTVDRAFVLQRLLKNEELLSVITRIKTLPSLPSLYAELLAEINSSNPSITRITEIITRDVTMIARVLQFVNSAFFSLPKKVTEVKRAVALLGINTIKALALYTQVFSSYKTLEHRGLSLGTLWEHSQEVGILAGKLINYMWPDKKLEESAIIIGVLHDLGKIPLLELPEYYTQLKLLQEKRGCSSVEGEYCLINTSHAEVGAYLLGLWGLPDSIIEPIAFHHYPSRIGDQEFSILSAVHIAEGLLDGRNESSSQLLDATGIENLDRQYIVDLKLIPYISEWKNICKKYRERSR